MANKKKKADVKALLDAARDVPCTDCKKYFGLKGNKGGSQKQHRMTLDHLPQFKKCFDFGDAARYPLKMVIEEIKKAEAVCAKCHGIRSHQRDIQPEVVIQNQWKLAIGKVFLILSTLSGKPLPQKRNDGRSRAQVKRDIRNSYVKRRRKYFQDQNKKERIHSSN